MYWALHRSGKWAPFDVDPSDDGEWELICDRHGPTTVVRVDPAQLQLGQGKGDGYASHLHTPHWATCPDADRWRKP